MPDLGAKNYHIDYGWLRLCGFCTGLHILWQGSGDKMAIGRQNVQLVSDHLLIKYLHILLKLRLFVTTCKVWVPKNVGHNVGDITEGFDTSRTLFDDVLHGYTTTLCDEDTLCPTFKKHQSQNIFVYAL